MEPTLLKKYVQSIEDFVFIEEKIVTFLWLSQVLKIHANTAKQLLYALSIKEDTKDKLLITYALGGELKNGKGKLLKLVIADSKESVKQRFSEITTDHVYSIQRSGGSFSSADVFNSYPHLLVSEEIRKFCPIKLNGEIEKRAVKHMTEIKNFLNDKPIMKQAAPKAKEEPKKDVKNDDINKPDKGVSNHSNESPSKQKKSSPNEKVVKNTKAGSLGSFFNRQTEKKSLEPPADKKEKAEKKEEKPKTGIGAFFKPGNKSDPPKKENKEKEVIPSLETKKAENDKEAQVPENVEQTPSVSAKDKKPKNKTNKRKRKKTDDEVGGGKKRRKRIVSAISSDSESSGNESSECEMEVEMEQPPPPLPVDDDEDMIPPTPGRKRVRKQIDKVFTDDDGYIITKKEFVYESCSDDEAKEEKKENVENNLKATVRKTPEKKKDISPNNSKKNKTNKNANNDNKQSSIMNFFKKKP